MPRTSRSFARAFAESFSFGTHVLQTELHRDAIVRSRWHVSVQMRAIVDTRETRSEYRTFDNLKAALDAISKMYADAVLADATNPGTAPLAAPHTMEPES